MELGRSPGTLRKAMATRLACLADTELHDRLRSGATVNGMVDLYDALDLWSGGPRDFEAAAAGIEPVLLQALLEFDAWLDEVYRQQAGFPDSAAWTWLWSAEASPAPLWHETVKRAGRLLTAFPDFDLPRWREAGHPVW